jgi:FkbM family methyltransferase
MVSCFIDGYHRPARPLPPCPVIVDLGANVGYTAIDFKDRYPDARVIGVEMDATNCAIARLNTAGLPMVEIINSAVWTSDGQVLYDATANADAFSARGADGQATNLVSVPAITMLSLFRQSGISRASFVKMDIEGAEKQLFEAEDLEWLNQVDQISIELHGTFDASFVKERLVAHGMEVCDSTRHWSTVIGWRCEEQRN